MKNVNNLRWENVVTDEQEERLERAFVKEFQLLINFLKEDLVFTSLLVYERQDGSRPRPIIVSGQKHSIDVAIYWGDDGPEFQYECNGHLVEWDGGWQVTKMLRDGDFYPSGVRETKKELEALRQELLNKSKKHLDKSGGLAASIGELRRLKKHPRIKNIRFFGIDIKGVNGSINICDSGELTWPAPSFNCRIRGVDIRKFLEMYGISRSDINHVKQMIEA